MTPRQTDVARLVAKGYTNKEIAAAMGVGEQAVKNHLLDLFEKFEVGNRVELLRALGWIVLPGEVGMSVGVRQAAERFIEDYRRAVAPSRYEDELDYWRERTAAA